MAGATGLEPATSAVTGQRSNQLSYAPVMGGRNARKTVLGRQAFATKKRARVTDAKEVGVGNPAEETCCHPNTSKCNEQVTGVNRPAIYEPGFTVAKCG